MTEALKIYKDFERIRRNNYGVILFERGEGEPHLGFLSIQAGLSWPNKTAPGYFCLIGQRTAKNARGRNPLVFIVEGEEYDPQQLFRLLTDQAARFFCEEIYSDLSETWQGYESLFDDYCKENKIEGIYLGDDPFRENFQIGLAIIRKWLTEKALTIDPGTILIEQLARIPREDLGSDAEVNYYAINSLRYVVGSFERSGGRRMTPQDVQYLEETQGGIRDWRRPI